MSVTWGAPVPGPFKKMVSKLRNEATIWFRINMCFQNAGAFGGIVTAGVVALQPQVHAYAAPAGGTPWSSPVVPPRGYALNSKTNPRSCLASIKVRKNEPKTNLNEPKTNPGYMRERQRNSFIISVSFFGLQPSAFSLLQALRSELVSGQARLLKADC